MNPSKSKRRQRFDRLLGKPIWYAIEALEERTLLNSYIVTNVNNSGSGSFRDAIQQANANFGLDTIEFKIDGSGVQTISPTFFLPPITDPVVITGETQALYTNKPLIELDGSLAGNCIGLEFRVGGNTVEGLNIHSFAQDGIVLAEPGSTNPTGGSSIVGNYLGTDPSGMNPKGNQTGIHLVHSPHNTIRGNLISGNRESGIFVADQFCFDNHIVGNLIGTDATGMGPLGNGINGVALGAPPVPDPGNGFASHNFVGGTQPGDRNVISGNLNSGVWIDDGTDNHVLGNYIGVGVDGKTPLGNGKATNTAQFGKHGVFIQGGTNNFIGGTDAGSGNVISGNSGDGVHIDATDSDTAGNHVQGNMIGVDKDGNFGVGLGNVEGVKIRNTSTVGAVKISGNIIGGTDADDGAIDGVINARNVISGNADDGILLLGGGVSGTLIEGNYIGTNKKGDKAVKNVNNGIELNLITGESFPPSGTIIGGNAPGAGNVISGNNQNGIAIENGAHDTMVQGNLIGTTADGLGALGNLINGIRIVNAASNTIGGLTASTRNVISANKGIGVVIVGSEVEAATGNVVSGNYIGTDKSGNISDPDGTPGTGDELGNSYGVVLQDANGNTIGRVETGGRNVISGNINTGVLIAGALATSNKVQANSIGVGADGVTKLANINGVVITQLAGGANGGLASNNTIGGIVNIAGTDIPAGNVVSANKQCGISIDTGAFGNQVSGNFIGTDFAGIAPLGNGSSGVFVQASPGNIIGGVSALSRNVIVNNQGNGVEIQNTGSSGNVVEGNYIGLGLDGAAHANVLNGVGIFDTGVNIVGGSVPGARNIISGNTRAGVRISGSTSVSNSVLGNYIGTDPAGNLPRPNGVTGVFIELGAKNNVIGAPGNLGRNVISGNNSAGVAIIGDATSGGTSPNTIQNNFIGLNATGDAALGNVGEGVYIQDSPNNIIGGDAGAGNVISGNTDTGIDLISGQTTFTLIKGNYIGTDKDAAKPIGNKFGILLTYDPTSSTPANTSILNNIIGGNLKAGIYLFGYPELAGGGNRHNTIQGNYIGTNPAMSTAIANHGYGIFLSDSTDNQIGGSAAGQPNVIAFTVDDATINANSVPGQGIEISGDQALRNHVEGNRIVGNLGSGIRISEGASQNVIGSTLFGGANVITQNHASGISITGIGTSGNTLQNNLIGIDETGAAKGNTLSGVRLIDGTHDNLIGGAGLTQGNTISANAEGIFILGGAHDNKLLQNRIGTDLLGAFRQDLGNTNVGIAIADSPNNTIGGLTDTPGTIAGNSIIGSGNIGIGISGTASTNTSVQGNLIDKTGFDGIQLITGASGNTVGGATNRAANRITNSGRAGVYVSAGINNAVRQNQIFNNTGQGIDLAPLGPTPNDPNKDSDTGPNQLQNFPVPAIAASALSNRIAGSLNSAASTIFTLEFFASSTAGAQGQRFLVSATVTTNASGHANFDLSIPAGESPGEFITATATDPLGNTSEFSAPIQLLVDSDGDGIPDQIESATPGGDANQDGIPDSNQGQVVSLPNSGNGAYITLVASPGTKLINVSASGNPSPDDAPTNVQFDAGFLDFKIPGITPGGQTSIDLTLPTTPAAYYRYGPTPDLPTPHWYNWFFDGQTGAVINGNHVTLHFIDGARGDDDLTANGTIVDTGGPAYPIRFNVTNTLDSGPGSLRQAIIDSNNHPGQDVIAFSIGTGVQTIIPLSTLPTITDSVIIDGTTQPGYAGKPIIEISGQSAPGSGLMLSAFNSTIRGLVINRFADYGIYLDRTGGLQPFAFNIVGNYLGTDVTGTLPRGNRWGIGVGAGSGVIGGTTPASANILSGNTLDGIAVFGGSGLQVEGNLIGLAADGLSALGNSEDGVIISNVASGTIVGGTAPGDANIIAFNVGCGIENYLVNNHCSFLSNSIYSNKLLGINLGAGSGADINDSGATDGAFSNLQNYPVLSSAISAAGQTNISGYLNSKPNQTYTLQFFSNPTVTLSGYGQGRTFLGSASVTTDSNGHVDFTATLGVAVSNGSLITATATDSIGNTSEFSLRLAVGDVLGNVYTVNTTDDTDDGLTNPAHMTLRDAILAADNHPGLDTIRFAIGGGGVQTIAPLVPLPAVTDSIIIDGTTQPGYSGTPLIQIIGTKMERPDLSASPTNLHLTGIYIGTNNSTVKGLAINSFYEFGTNSGVWGGTPISVNGDNNVLEANFFGTDVTGTVAMPNLLGALIFGGGNRIGGTTPAQRNIFSGNFEYGLMVEGPGPGNGTASGASNIIEGNFIGTDITGTKALGNGRGASFGSFGINIIGSNILGGSTPGAGNVISGNLGDGVELHRGEGTIIQGNFIGTDVTGTKLLGNPSGGNGITIFDNDFQPVTGVTIGGTHPGEGNIISGNSFGIVTGGDQFDVIQGNKIGTDITGTLDFGNLNDGIVIQGSSNTIGGTAPGAGNLISGNNRFGILLDIYSQTATGNVVQGNKIGTQADGFSPLGNSSDGIAIATDLTGGTSGTGPTDNFIGGIASGAANIIAFNGGRGVNIRAGLDIAVLSNSIYSNGSLGIDLNGDGVTANDTNDTDTGDNNLQNFPVLATAVTDGVRSTVTGTLNSTPGTFFMLQFFASASADPSGFGEGQTLLGTRQFITDAAGNATFTFSFPVAVPVGQLISATATEPLNNTSEFSHTIQVTGGTVTPNQPPTANAGSYTINEGSPLTLDASRSSDPDGDPLTFTWDVNGDGVFGDATGAKPTLSWAQLQELGIVDGPSSFNVKIRVDDGQGHAVTSSPSTLIILNVAPTVSAGPDLNVIENDLVTLTGTFTDPGTADTQTLNWHVVASNNQVIADGSSSSFSFRPLDNGTYTVTFKVTDDDGGIGSAVVVVKVANAKPLATIVGLPAQGILGAPLHLSASVTDPSPVDTTTGFGYFWEASLEDNDEVDFFAETPDFSFTPTLPGTYDLFFLVNDKDGGRATVSTTLTVPAPVRDANFNPGGGGHERITVNFDQTAGPAALSLDDFKVQDAVTGDVVDPADMALAYDAATKSAVITFPGLPGTHLIDGRYRLTIPGTDYRFDFFRLNGDATRNATVDFNDLVTVAQNYERTDPQLSWSDGDFNGDGKVDFADLVAVAQNYGRSLPSIPAAVSTPSSVPAPASAQTLFERSVGEHSARSAPIRAFSAKPLPLSLIAHRLASVQSAAHTTSQLSIARGRTREHVVKTPAMAMRELGKFSTARLSIPFAKYGSVISPPKKAEKTAGTLDAQRLWP